MNHRTESPASESAEQLIQNIQKLMDEVEAIVNKSAHSESAEFGGKLDELQHRLAAAAERAGGAYRAARQRIATGAHRADETIRAHPYESLAISLGIGVLLGALLRRRD